jgi:Arm DNA-binding domain
LTYSIFDSKPMAKGKITIKSVAQLAPSQILWDDGIRGFAARRQFSSVVTYSIFFGTQDGIQRFYKIGRHGVFTPETARREAQRVLMSVALGQDPSADRHTRRNSTSLSELCDDYLADMISGRIPNKR